MPTTPLNAVKELLKRGADEGQRAQDTISYVMDLLFYGDFQIVEQVASTDDHDFVNLIGIRGHQTDQKPLWLVSHITTGNLPVPSTWSETGGDPYAPTVDNEHGVLYGLGVASGKVDLVLKLLAASHFLTDELARPIYFIAMIGDEGRSSGMRSLLSLARSSGGYALLGAPTNLTIRSVHPGCVAVDVLVERRVRHRRMPTARGFFHITVDGRTSHAQLPALGEDAIEKATHLISELRNHGEIRVLSVKGGRGASSVPGTCELCIAASFETLPAPFAELSARPLADGDAVPFPIDPMMRAWEDVSRDAQQELNHQIGAADWGDLQAPAVYSHVAALRSGRDSLRGTLTFWHPPTVSPGDIAEQVNQILQARVASDEELEGSVRIVQDQPSLNTPRDGEFQQAVMSALSEVNMPPIWSAESATTDAGFLQEAGVETVAFGPGAGAHSLYQDNEHIPVQHLDAALRFYKNLIERFCVKRN